MDKNKKQNGAHVAPTGPEMDKKFLSDSTGLNWQNHFTFKHLTPLSKYSRMMVSTPEDDVKHPRKMSDRVITLKVEIPNSCGQKRKIDDSSQDEGYETPAKRPFSPTALSPDLGCFMDLCSPSSNHNLSPFVSQAALLDKPPLVETETKDTVDSQHATCGPLNRAEGGDGHEDMKYPKVPLNLEPHFDFDIDGVLSLSPARTGCRAGLSDSDTVQPLPVLVPTEAHRQEWQGGSGTVKEEPKEQVIEVDPVLGSVNPPVELLEGEAEELWNIGPPLFESSLCHILTTDVDAGSEQIRHEAKKLLESVMLSEAEVLSIGDQASVFGGEDSLATSYDSTLPLQVQVKSVVVVVQHQNLKPDDHTGSHTAGYPNRASRRPVFFRRWQDWEHAKLNYVHLVSEHLNEWPAARNDAVTELQALMSSVAAQRPGSIDTRWQHPSDFTRRNYRQRFRNLRSRVSLSEWRAMSGERRRFARVPEVFKRTSRKY